MFRVLLAIALMTIVGAEASQDIYIPVVEYVPSEATNDKEESESRLRWGILGTAEVAEYDIIPLLQTSTHSSVAAIASRTKGKAKKIAAKHKIPKIYGCYQELIDDPDIDVIYIALPNHLHKKWTVKAAQAGKHILCEKPLATTPSDCQAMLEASQQAGVKLMEGLKYRYHPQIDRVRELLEANTVGVPLLIRASISYPLVGMDIDDSFRWSAKQGGGCAQDIGCYCVHISRLLFNAEPLSVAATFVEDPAHPAVDAQLHAILTFPESRTAIIDCSFLTEERQEVEVIGSEGRLIMRQAFHPGVHSPSLIEWLGSSNLGAEEQPDMDVYEQEIHHFVTCIRQGEEPLTNGSDAALNSKVVNAMLRSAKAGKSVRID